MSMIFIKHGIFILLVVSLCMCRLPEDNLPSGNADAIGDVKSVLSGPDSSHVTETPILPVPATPLPTSAVIEMGQIPRDSIVQFAKRLQGVSYKYASTDPLQGFDCSGFITYVFNHFGISVPRSSVDFTHVGKEVSEIAAQPGDLILFTGTDSSTRVVGHMGIVIENADSLRFIHSSSGKANGVTITPLNKYYRGRFVKVIDIY